MWDREVHVGYNHLTAAKFDIAMTSTIPRGSISPPPEIFHKFYLYLILQGTNETIMFGRVTHTLDTAAKRGALLFYVIHIL